MSAGNNFTRLKYNILPLQRNMKIINEQTKRRCKMSAGAKSIHFSQFFLFISSTSDKGTEAEACLQFDQPSSADAPEIISINSVVMDAWRVLVTSERCKDQSNWMNNK